jgi:hypothetical protein
MIFRKIVATLLICMELVPSTMVYINPPSAYALQCVNYSEEYGECLQWAEDTTFNPDNSYNPQPEPQPEAPQPNNSNPQEGYNPDQSYNTGEEQQAPQEIDYCAMYGECGGGWEQPWNETPPAEVAPATQVQEPEYHFCDDHYYEEGCPGYVGTAAPGWSFPETPTQIQAEYHFCDDHYYEEGCPGYVGTAAPGWSFPETPAQFQSTYNYCDEHYYEEGCPGYVGTAASGWDFYQSTQQPQSEYHFCDDHYYDEGCPGYVGTAAPDWSFPQSTSSTAANPDVPMAPTNGPESFPTYDITYDYCSVNNYENYTNFGCPGYAQVNQTSPASVCAPGFFSVDGECYNTSGQTEHQSRPQTVSCAPGFFEISGECYDSRGNTPTQNASTFKCPDGFNNVNGECYNGLGQTPYQAATGGYYSPVLATSFYPDTCPGGQYNAATASCYTPNATCSYANNQGTFNGRFDTLGNCISFFDTTSKRADQNCDNSDGIERYKDAEGYCYRVSSYNIHVPKKTEKIEQQTPKPERVLCLDYDTVGNCVRDANQRRPGDACELEGRKGTVRNDGSCFVPPLASQQGSYVVASCVQKSCDTNFNKLVCIDLKVDDLGNKFEASGSLTQESCTDIKDAKALSVEAPIRVSECEDSVCQKDAANPQGVRVCIERWTYKGQSFTKTGVKTSEACTETEKIQAQPKPLVPTTVVEIAKGEYSLAAGGNYIDNNGVLRSFDGDGRSLNYTISPDQKSLEFTGCDISEKVVEKDGKKTCAKKTLTELNLVPGQTCENGAGIVNNDGICAKPEQLQSKKTFMSPCDDGKGYYDQKEKCIHEATDENLPAPIATVLNWIDKLSGANSSKQHAVIASVTADLSQDRKTLGYTGSPLSKLSAGERLVTGFSGDFDDSTLARLSAMYSEVRNDILARPDDQLDPQTAEKRKEYATKLEQAYVSAGGVVHGEKLAIGSTAALSLVGGGTAGALVKNYVVSGAGSILGGDAGEYVGDKLGSPQTGRTIGELAGGIAGVSALHVTQTAIGTVLSNNGKIGTAMALREDAKRLLLKAKAENAPAEDIDRLTTLFNEADQKAAILLGEPIAATPEIAAKNVSILTGDLPAAPVVIEAEQKGLLGGTVDRAKRVGSYFVDKAREVTGRKTFDDSVIIETSFKPGPEFPSSNAYIENPDKPGTYMLIASKLEGISPEKAKEEAQAYARTQGLRYTPADATDGSARIFNPYEMTSPVTADAASKTVDPLKDTRTFPVRVRDVAKDVFEDVKGLFGGKKEPEVVQVRPEIPQRAIFPDTEEINQAAKQVRDINLKITQAKLSGADQSVIDDLLDDLDEAEEALDIASSRSLLTVRSVDNGTTPVTPSGTTSTAGTGSPSSGATSGSTPTRPTTGTGSPTSTAGSSGGTSSGTAPSSTVPSTSTATSAQVDPTRRPPGVQVDLPLDPAKVSDIRTGVWNGSEYHQYPLRSSVLPAPAAIPANVALAGDSLPATQTVSTSSLTDRVLQVWNTMTGNVSPSQTSTTTNVVGTLSIDGRSVITKTLVSPEEELAYLQRDRAIIQELLKDTNARERAAKLASEKAEIVNGGQFYADELAKINSRIRELQNSSIIIQAPDLNTNMVLPSQHLAELEATRNSLQQQVTEINKKIVAAASSAEKRRIEQEGQAVASELSRVTAQVKTVQATEYRAEVEILLENAQKIEQDTRQKYISLLGDFNAGTVTDQELTAARLSATNATNRVVQIENQLNEIALTVEKQTSPIPTPDEPNLVQRLFNNFTNLFSKKSTPTSAIDDLQKQPLGTITSPKSPQVQALETKVESLRQEAQLRESKAKDIHQQWMSDPDSRTLVNELYKLENDVAKAWENVRIAENELNIVRKSGVVETSVPYQNTIDVTKPAVVLDNKLTTSCSLSMGTQSITSSAVLGCAIRPVEVGSSVQASLDSVKGPQLNTPKLEEFQPQTILNAQKYTGLYLTDKSDTMVAVVADAMEKGASPLHVVSAAKKTKTLVDDLKAKPNGDGTYSTDILTSGTNDSPSKNIWDKVVFNTRTTDPELFQRFTSGAYTDADIDALYPVAVDALLQSERYATTLNTALKEFRTSIDGINKLVSNLDPSLKNNPFRIDPTLAAKITDPEEYILATVTERNAQAIGQNAPLVKNQIAQYIESDNALVLADQLDANKANTAIQAIVLRNLRANRVVSEGADGIVRKTTDINKVRETAMADVYQAVFPLPKPGTELAGEASKRLKETGDFAKSISGLYETALDQYAVHLGKELQGKSVTQADIIFPEGKQFTDQLFQRLQSQYSPEQAKAILAYQAEGGDPVILAKALGGWDATSSQHNIAAGYAAIADAMKKTIAKDTVIDPVQKSTNWVNRFKLKIAEARVNVQSQVAPSPVLNPNGASLPLNLIETVYAADDVSGSTVQLVDAKVYESQVKKELIKMAAEDGHIDEDYISQVINTDIFGPQVNSLRNGAEVITGNTGRVELNTVQGSYTVNARKLDGVDITIPSKIVIKDSETMMYLGLRAGSGDVKKVTQKHEINLLEKAYAEENDKNARVTLITYQDKNGNGQKDDDEEVLPWAGISIELQKTESDQSIPLMSGWNLVNIPHPVKSSFTASSLLQYIQSQGGYSTTVSKLENGRWSSFVIRGDKSFGGDDFAIEEGKGYFVKTQRPVTIRVTTDISTSQKVMLQEGWNAVSGDLQKTPESAKAFIENIGTEVQVESITEYESGQLNTFLQKGSDDFGDDFPIKSYKGYLIKLKKGGAVSI